MTQIQIAALVCNQGTLIGSRDERNSTKSMPATPLRGSEARTIMPLRNRGYMWLCILTYIMHLHHSASCSLICHNYRWVLALRGRTASQHDELFFFFLFYSFTSTGYGLIKTLPREVPLESRGLGWWCWW